MPILDIYRCEIFACRILHWTCLRLRTVTSSHCYNHLSSQCKESLKVAIWTLISSTGQRGERMRTLSSKTLNNWSTTANV